MHKFILTTLLFWNCSFIYWSFSQSIYFPPLTGNSWDTISPQSLNYCPERIDSLFHFLELNNSKAFILLKNGKIVLEKYFGTTNQNTLLPWNSAGKTITALMVGIAQQEGYLNISDSSSKYMGTGWTSCTPSQEGKITIRNQLTMTSGLNDSVADPFCTTSNCLVYKSAAGTRWAYHNAPYTLLDSVIQVATSKTLNQYVNQKLKTVTGITGQFYKIGYNNIFISNARSMARFGILILNKGNWSTTQLITDTTYFNQMINTSQQLNKSYGYLWWLNGKSSYMIPQSQLVFNGPLFPNAPNDVFAAIGKDGQFLNICPSLGLVWLRLGDSSDGLPVPFLLNDAIWDYVNKLNCSSGVSNQKDNFRINVFTNLEDNGLIINSSELILHYEIINSIGQKVNEANPSEKSININLKTYSSGLYFVKVNTSVGDKSLKFLVK